MNNNLILDDNILVSAKNIGMSFILREKLVNTLKERFIALFRGENKHKKLKVLNDISFEIKPGESLGVIGHNGAGKSTLLKIVAGIYRPTEGKITTNGRIVLLNLGAGFDMEASAEENIFLNGAILGFTRKQMKERYESIVEFSELGKFMKMPLKNFSSGMISRLGFAIAIDVHPDLMLVDEVLSVGDANFSKKCMAKIEELKKSGVSFMFVSHSIGQVQHLCEKTLWLENATVQEYGDSKTVCAKYLKYCSELSGQAAAAKPAANTATGTAAQTAAAGATAIAASQPTPTKPTTAAPAQPSTAATAKSVPKADSAAQQPTTNNAPAANTASAQPASATPPAQSAPAAPKADSAAQQSATNNTPAANTATVQPAKAPQPATTQSAPAASKAETDTKPDVSQPATAAQTQPVAATPAQSATATAPTQPTTATPTASPAPSKPQAASAPTNAAAKPQDVAPTAKPTNSDSASEQKQ